MRGMQKHQGRRSHGRIQRRRTSGRLQPCPSVGVPDKKDTDEKHSYRQRWKIAHATYGGEIMRGYVKSNMKI